MLRRKNQTRVGQVCCAASDALATWPATLVTGLVMQSRHDAELASVATANSHSTRYLPTGFAGNKKLVVDRGPRQAVKWAGSAGRAVWTAANGNAARRSLSDSIGRN